MSSEAETVLLLFRQTDQQAALLGAWLSLFLATKEALWHLINSTPTVNTNKHKAPKAEAHLVQSPSPCMLPLCKCLTVASTLCPSACSRGLRIVPQDMYLQMASSFPILTLRSLLHSSLISYIMDSCKHLGREAGLSDLFSGHWPTFLTEIKCRSV